jgi:hypothetical protein
MAACGASATPILAGGAWGAKLGQDAVRQAQNDMTPMAFMAAVAAFSIAVCAAAAQTAPARPNTIKQMFAQLNGCMAGVRLAKGTDVTLRFSLNRRGGLIGKPRITYGHWTGDEADRKASAASIAQGFDQCLPLNISDALGRAIAGQMIVYRVRGAREDKV